MDSIKAIIKALRGGSKGENPDNPKLKPIEKRGRGYQLYVKEAQVMGETPLSYEEWIKGQE